MRVKCEVFGDIALTMGCRFSLSDTKRYSGFSGSFSFSFFLGGSSSSTSAIGQKHMLIPLTNRWQRLGV